MSARKYKKKTVQSRDIRLFLPGSTERQAGRDGKTVVMNFVRIWHGFRFKECRLKKILRVFNLTKSTEICEN